MHSSTGHLLSHGLRYNDACTVIPAGGPRRKVRLNRTCWDILPEGETTDAPAIYLPGMAPRSFRWRLELARVSDDQSRFLLRSLDQRPFALNGQWAREAFVEAHDTLCPDGPARLEFTTERPRDSFRPPAWPALLDNEAALRSSLSFLLEGETGTGKGFLAREIHQRSGRTGPFVSVNVQAFASSMVEAELFGHKRGAFTGALSDRRGAIAQAQHGTLFLDEIDSLPLDLQTKLLLFLDDQRYRPVGAEREEQARVRLVFAAGRSLQQQVAKGCMRADFFFRLQQGYRIELQPLRKRSEDIARYCDLFAIDEGVTVSHRLVQFYQSLPWPGNIRQLRGHLLMKKTSSKTNKLDFDTCDDALMTMTSSLDGLPEMSGPIRPMEEVKRAYAVWAIGQGHHELGWTAKQLGVNPKTLRSWLTET